MILGVYWIKSIDLKTNMALIRLVNGTTRTYSSISTSQIFKSRFFHRSSWVSLTTVNATIDFSGGTAHQDLEVLLKRKHKSFSAQAALLFTCNGRGSRMFSDPNHDAKTIANELGAIPLAGFFAQGEMGPVAGKTYLHGFTASLALFR